MNICVPKERRPFEYRVGLTPSAVEALVAGGHTCYVEHNAGLGAGFNDQDYEQAGARISYTPHEVFGRADLLLKYARPLQDELEWMRPETTFAGMLHLASARQDKIDTLVKNRITAIAFEQVELPDGSRPVLRPMSQIGGRMAAQTAGLLLQNNAGGKGILLGGITGVPAAEVVVIGAGVVGTYATQAFLGMGAHVIVLDTDLNALERIHETYPVVTTLISSPRNIARVCSFADVVVGAVLVTGERAPLVVTRNHQQTMKPRAILMDISIDQGGCFETSRPTTHEHPTFILDGVIHYCVPNMPGVVARTSTYAYVNAALPYILELANLGIEEAISKNEALGHAVNSLHGEMVNLGRLLPKQMAG
jgi:alanine dehydrogenase